MVGVNSFGDERLYAKVRGIEKPQLSEFKLKEKQKTDLQRCHRESYRLSLWNLLHIADGDTATIDSITARHHGDLAVRETLGEHANLVMHEEPQEPQLRVVA